MKSFLSGLETIGKDILSGIEKVAPIIAKLSPEVSEIPVVGPALAEVAVVITSLEQKGMQISPDDLSQIVQTLVSAAQLKSGTANARPQSAQAPAGGKP